MLGEHFLFVPGPSHVPESIQRAMHRSMDDHRSPLFPELVLPLLEDIKKVFKTSTGDVLLYPASGTAGWEAAITNTLSPGDQVLIPIHGEFSARWANLAAKHKLSVYPIKSEWGESASAEKIYETLLKDSKNSIKAVFIVQNETSTGVVSDIKAIRNAIDMAQHPALLFVDGISSIGGIDFRQDEWGVDIAVCGSQKCFMLPPGLAMISISEKVKSTFKYSKCSCAYFDFNEMLAANKNGYFPYTPPVSLLYGLRESLNLLFDEGLENVYARHRHLANGVRSAIAAWGLELCAKDPQSYSDTVSSVVLPEHINSNDVIKYAFDNYNLSLGAGLSSSNGKIFRIGHLGAVNELMLAGALCGVEMALLDASIEIELGSGVRAALEKFQVEKKIDTSVQIN
tara:strand:+ start:24233 stop:25426 length:1194 start_codon:yes stop_codon:yes gene_type:complete